MRLSPPAEAPAFAPSLCLSPLLMWPLRAAHHPAREATQGPRRGRGRRAAVGAAFRLVVLASAQESLAGQPQCVNVREPDCSVLRALQPLAPACLAKVSPQELCGWRGAGMDQGQGIMCRDGRVTALGLQNCGVTSLPDSIGNLTSVTDMALSQNYGLRTLPDSFGNLRGLQSIGMVGNGLTSLPESIGNLINLRVLILSHNALPALPQSIGNLPALTTLIADNNRLVSLPASITQLTTLAQLHLQDNFLQYLPHDIGNLDANNVSQGFFILYVDGNLLHDLPSSMAKLTHLVYFTAARNELGQLTNAKLETLLAGMGSANNFSNAPTYWGKRYPQAARMEQFEVAFNLNPADVRLLPSSLPSVSLRSLALCPLPCPCTPG